MNDYYDLGVIAAVSELEQEALHGEKIAANLLKKLPEALKKLPSDVKRKAVDYGKKVKNVGSKEYGKAKKDLSDSIFGYDRAAYKNTKKRFPKDTKAQQQAVKDTSRLKKKDRAMAALKTVGRGAVIGGLGYGAKKAID